MSNPEETEIKIEKDEEKVTLVSGESNADQVPPASAPIDSTTAVPIPVSTEPKVEVGAASPNQYQKLDKSEVVAEPTVAYATVVVTEQPNSPIDEISLNDSESKPVKEKEKVELKDIQK